MGFWDRLRTSPLVTGARANDADNPALQRSPLEQDLIKRLQAELPTQAAPGTAETPADSPAGEATPSPAPSSTAPMQHRFYLRFTGRVQGVGFRYTNMTIADKLGLTGWIENLDDGSVDMEIQGTAAGIIRHLDTLHTTYQRMRCRIWLEELREIRCADDDGFRMAN